MKILCRRRHETITNLASEFGVSERTIRRDVETLSLTEPIYTQTGRYGGGVYVVEGYSINQLYLSESEISLLEKVCNFAEKQGKHAFSADELKRLRQIVSTYSKPLE